MTLSLQTFIFLGILALAIGLIGSFMASSGRHKRKLVASREDRNFARQPWGGDGQNDRGIR
jgi:hypothetical protein